jgi:signal transduction histidine kinase
LGDVRNPARPRGQSRLRIVAHDLKNPLTAIKGTAQVLHRRAEGSESDPERLLESDLDRTGDGTDGGIARRTADLAHLQMERPLELARQPTDC